MGSVGLLMCGEPKGDGIAKAALSQLAGSIDAFSTRAIRLLRAPSSKDALALGPFCARVLLENACTALVARLDAFRILYLSEFQRQPEYDLNRPMKAAFSWTGDVIPESPPGRGLWSHDHDFSKISRALLSQHMEYIFWRPAVESMLDFVSEHPYALVAGDLRAIDSSTFINAMKGRATQLYSTLSKGVHWEFLTTSLILDEITVKNAIRETCILVGTLGLVSHFIPTAYASLSHRRAFGTYLSLRSTLT